MDAGDIVVFPAKRRFDCVLFSILYMFMFKPSS